MNIESVFAAAIALDSRQERDALLDRVCADDPELRCDVEALLRHHDHPVSLLDRPNSSLLPAFDPSTDTDLTGDKIGPYKIREQLAEGGMGIVYVAEQEKPVRRKVALKVIKPGMATKNVVARFESERQALAMMDHPNIARVFDGGETAAGQQYFVMELVLGIPITEFCDQQKLTTRERLELFLKVCRAVQHAHQRGVIHRDLKPSNVLVAEINDAAVPKVIDFGVAKAVSHKLTEQTVYTQVSQMVGTPLYMSPEQAAMGVVDVDTRSDVYSLGVLLYELLTGQTPFDRESLKQAGFDEMRRVIREDEPSRPSELVSTLQGQALSTVADRRRSDPQKLVHALHGELDWITLKALEKDRNRRYESASSVAQDIERYLDGDAVHACPPSAIYRLRKFSLRYRAAITTVGLLTVALLAGTVTTTWQMLRAIEAERVAEAQTEQARQQADRAQAEVERAEAESQRATSEAAIAQAINDFVNRDLLGQADLRRQKRPDPDLRLGDVVDRAAAKVRDQFQKQPLVEAAIRQTLGHAYSSLGAAEQFAEHAQRSWDIRRSVLGESHPDTLGSMSDVAGALADQNSDAEAMEMMRELLELSRKALGDEHEQTLEAKHNLAVRIGVLGAPAKAERLLREVLEVWRRLNGEHAPETLAAEGDLAMSLFHQGQHAEAERILRDVLKRRRRVQGNEHLDTLFDIGRLASAVAARGGHREAETLWREALEFSRNTWGDEHPDTLGITGQLAASIGQQGRYLEAETLLRKALQPVSDQHPKAAQLKLHLSTALSDQGRFEKAVVLARDVLTRTRRDHSDDDEIARGALANLSYCLAKESWKLSTAADPSNRDPDKALELAQELVSLRPHTEARAGNLLGVALCSASKWQQSVDTLEKAHKLSESDDRKYHMFMAIAYCKLGEHETSRRRYAEGAAWIAARRKNDAEQQRFRAEAEHVLGLSQQDRSDLIDEFYSKGELEDPQFLTGRGLWHLGRGNDVLALVDLRKAVSLAPEEGYIWNAWNHVALTHYRKCNWEGAEFEARLATQLASDSPSRMLGIVPLLLLAGKHDEYREVCERLMERWEEWRGNNLANAAVSCALDPHPPSNPEHLLRLARRATEEGADWSIHSLHRAYIRVGEYEKAICEIQSHAKTEGAQARFTLAIAHHLAGHQDEARMWLEKAVQTLEDWDAKHANPRMETAVLRHEAERLILGNDASSGVTASSDSARAA